MRNRSPHCLLPPGSFSQEDMSSWSVLVEELYLLGELWQIFSLRQRGTETRIANWYEKFLWMFLHFRIIPPVISERLRLVFSARGEFPIQPSLHHRVVVFKNGKCHQTEKDILNCRIDQGRTVWGGGYCIGSDGWQDVGQQRALIVSSGMWHMTIAWLWWGGC